MKIILAQNAGFCFGVEHAVHTAYGLIDPAADAPADCDHAAVPSQGATVYMLGELIHNRQVVDDMLSRGMRLADRPEDIPDGAAVLIRAHGISPATLDDLQARKCLIYNCTCPFVAKIHRIVHDAWVSGSKIIIAGMPGHPEVDGINGETQGQAVLVKSVRDAEELVFSGDNWVIVAQTTFSWQEYQVICEILKKKIAKLQIFDTICITTENRQKEACEISSQVGLMLVIGSPGSSNTRKLLDICFSQCGETVLIERPDQVAPLMQGRDLRDLTVGITAGASTPERIIREVIHAMAEQEALQKQQETQMDQQDLNNQVPKTVPEQPETIPEQPETVPEQPEKQTEDAAAAAEPVSAAAVAQITEPEAAQIAEPVAEPMIEEPKKLQADEPQEEQADQSDISFTDFIDNIPHLKRGATVRGSIIRYDNEMVYVDVHDKSEGRIPRHEFEGDPDFSLDQAIEDHTEIDVYVRNIRNSDLGKEIILSKARVDFGKYKGLIEEAYANKTPINVKVVNVVKDGVIASFGGVDIYIHRTQIEMGMISDLEQYKGKTLDILVTQFDPDKKRLRVSGSRRALLAIERRGKAEELWSTIEIGKEYDGVVRSLTDFGAFVDIGGVDGLVHISELSWNRIRHPSEVVSVGDQIHVYVKDFDPEKKRISLGYKRASDDPYHDVESRFPVGSIVHGTVVRMFPFGAFIEIAPGVDALCHISQIANVRLTKPNEVLSEGMEVDARVLEVSNDARRVSISIKEVEPINPPGYEESHGYEG